mgnify:FL=1
MFKDIYYKLTKLGGIKPRLVYLKIFSKLNFKNLVINTCEKFLNILT